MSKVIAIMSMSLDGYVADPHDGVGEVFDWYMNSGGVEIHTGGADPMTFKVSGPSAEHLRGLTSGLGAMLRAPQPLVLCAVSSQVSQTTGRSPSGSVAAEPFGGSLQMCRGRGRTASIDGFIAQIAEASCYIAERGSQTANL